MLYDKVQEHIENTRHLGFREKIKSLRSFFVELNSSNISRNEITEKEFLSILQSFVKERTSDQIKTSLQYYLSYIIGDLLNTLDSSQSNFVSVETESNDDLEDWAKMAPDEVIDLNPEEMATYQEDEEFLKLMGVDASNE